MIEALWSLEFATNNNFSGAGVAVFETGRIFGGDSSYYYVGRYSTKDNIATATITATHYYGPKNNVFGPLDSVTIEFVGAIDSKTFLIKGRPVGIPGELTVRLTRRAELP